MYSGGGAFGGGGSAGAFGGSGSFWRFEGEGLCGHVLGHVLCIVAQVARDESGKTWAPMTLGCERRVVVGAVSHFWEPSQCFGPAANVHGCKTRGLPHGDMAISLFCSGRSSSEAVDDTAMSELLLKRLTPQEIPYVRRNPVDKKARTIAEPIVEAVREEGEPALRRYAEQFGELQPGAKLLYTRDAELKAAYDRVGQDVRDCLERIALRIRKFAQAQRDSIVEVTIPIPGGEAGHTVEPVEAAGCYAPGGRYPLPSTVLMTAVTARVAGCQRVVVASPRPSDVTLAA
eukprot:1063682-Prymnesium_polylepis.1